MEIDSDSEVFNYCFKPEEFLVFKSKIGTIKTTKFALLAHSIKTGENVTNYQKTRFDLEVLTDADCKFFFRFTKCEIERLANLFGLPEVIITDDKSKFGGIEALCITLRRMVYPNRLGDLRKMFGRSISQLSRFFNWVLKFILNEFGHLLESMDLFWLEPEYLAYYGKKIHGKGALLTKCVGFVDGTLRPICRPGFDQKEYYSGHKRVHGVKFQSLVMPNGLISSLFGPMPGRRHDSYMLAISGLLPKLEKKFGEEFYVYGDPAYPIRGQLIAPFRRAHLSANEEKFNCSMSKVREAVEWEFGRLVSLFAFVDFKKNLKLHLQPVGKYYKLAALLANCHACLNGTTTSAYFGVNPPTLDQYLTNSLG